MKFGEKKWPNKHHKLMQKKADFRRNVMSKKRLTEAEIETKTKERETKTLRCSCKNGKLNTRRDRKYN